MFTSNFNNYLSKSQEANILTKVKKDFWINFITNILLVTIFTTLFLNTRSNIFNIFFLCVILFCGYNSFTTVRDYTNLKIYFKLKGLKNKFEDISEFVIEEKDFILQINSQLEKVITPVPVAEKNFIEAIEEIEKVIVPVPVAEATIFNTTLDEVFSNSAIEDIINPNLKKKAKQKLKHIEKTEKIKGNITKKIEECLNYVSVTEYGVVTGSYCKNKYCPTCSKIKELKNKYLIEKLLNNFSDRTILFATFTVTSIVIKSVEETKEHRERVTKAFSKMMRSFKNITGYIKKVETVYNEETRKLNIHIHSFLLATNYANEYIKKEEWKKKWQHYTGDEKAKEIKIILINKEKKSLNKLSGYISKEDIDKMKISNEISNLFEIVEKNKRDITYSGEFREAKKIIEAEEKKNRKEWIKTIGEELVNLYWDKGQNTYIN
jgi:repA